MDFTYVDGCDSSTKNTGGRSTSRHSPPLSTSAVLLLTDGCVCLSVWLWCCDGVSSGEILTESRELLGSEAAREATAEILRSRGGESSEWRGGVG